MASVEGVGVKTGLVFVAGLGLIAWVSTMPACETTVPSHARETGRDGSVELLDLAPAALDGAAADLAPPPDGLSPPAAHGVRCADTLCYGEANQYCHTTDWGQSGVCVVRPAPAPGYYSCDGPEDCTSGACCFLDSSSVCGALGFCVSGTTVGEFMCHTDKECGQLSRCCPKGTTGSYRSCVDGLAPGDLCPNPP